MSVHLGQIVEIVVRIIWPLFNANQHVHAWSCFYASVSTCQQQLHFIAVQDLQVSIK
jgi:hypothetical protein